jgi:hypothetical protein
MLMLSAFPRVARAQQRDTLQGHFDPIDEADLIDLLLGFDLVQEQLSASTIEKTRQLGRRLATGYLGTRLVGDPSTGLNNWQSHRIKLATAGAYLAGDTELIAGARKGFMEQVSRNIDTDGRTYDFGQRDAMHYVVYDPRAAIDGRLHRGGAWGGL